MPEPQVAPYGAWVSPITAERIVEGSIGLGQIALDGDDTYWIELRPAEKGRTAIVRRDAAGEIADVIAPEFSARTRAHEYGGGAFAVDNGTVWFCNDSDQRIYVRESGGKPQALTPEGPYRFADLIVDRAHSRLVAVREDHTPPAENEKHEPANELVAVGFHGTVEVLASGADFYAAPRLSPDGGRLAWIQWNHPNMPWDGTELMIVGLDGTGGVVDPGRVAGGADESIFQPEFAPTGELYFASDRSGWWNLYRLDGEGEADAVFPLEAEFGLPHWVFGMATYGFSAAGRIVTTFGVDGVAKLAEIDVGTGALRTIPVPYIDIAGLKARPGGAVFVGAGLRAAAALVAVDLAHGRTEVLRRSTEIALDAADISIAQPMDFPTEDGLTAHAFFYPPRNAVFEGPEGALPPLIVKSHGGPTGQTSCAFSLRIQYWTSRGFAVLDVNYGGSTGFGRDYRRRLDGKWGVVDVDDCVNGAKCLVAQGLVDGARVAITGGSAGGYTTLSALAFRDAFRAGASHYGIGDLGALARDTHKFESRYLDRLVGRWPQDEAVYKARSPIEHVDGLSCPVIFFQGMDDKVVPPSQAEEMVAALKAKGIPVAYVPFEGEGHGFRQAANIKRALEGELYFYGRVFGFEPAEAIDPVEIENLD